MPILIDDVWVYPENLRRALIIRRLHRKGLDHVTRRTTDRRSP
jgi:hypothetical protein